MKKSKKILLGTSFFLVVLLIIAFSPSTVETHQNERIIQVPKNIAWAVISDVGNYNKYATGLTEVKILSGQQEGMVRSCSHGDKTWTEISTYWDEGTSYAFSVNTAADDYPYPFKLFNGTWTLESETEEKTLLSIHFEYQFPQRWMKWFFNNATHDALNDGNKTLLDNWEKKMQEDFRN